MVSPLWEPRAFHVPSSCRSPRPEECLTVTFHEAAALPVFVTRPIPMYPCPQLALTPSRADKTGVGRAEERDGEGDGDRECEREARDGDGDKTGETDGEGDGEGDGDGEGEGEEATGTTTRAASAGPTARTATHTTSKTRTPAAALRTRRAGASGRTAACFAGNGPTFLPSEDRPGQYLIRPYP
jgi:hypothetical protein